MRKWAVWVLTRCGVVRSASPPPPSSVLPPSPRRLSELAVLLPPVTAWAESGALAEVLLELGVPVLDRLFFPADVVASMAAPVRLQVMGGLGRAAASCAGITHLLKTMCYGGEPRVGPWVAVWGGVRLAACGQCRILSE